MTMYICGHGRVIPYYPIGGRRRKKRVRRTNTMKREELTAAGLSDEQVEKVMKLNGDDINREKAKYSDYDDVQKQLEKANATIEGWKDYDAIKADVAKYQQEAENARKEAAAKVQPLEDKARVTDFTRSK